MATGAVIDISDMYKCIKRCIISGIFLSKYTSRI